MGFWLSKDGIKPTDETLQAIREFPRPTDITGIRSWFGLVEQVSFAFSKTTLMEPFRALLKPKSEYCWTEGMQAAFERAKAEITSIVAAGVKSFVLGNKLCLVTDWSRTGMGYVLWMKTCRCIKVHPTCRKDGWSVVSVGSRFCTPAESRYAPIEGELGSCWE